MCNRQKSTRHAILAWLLIAFIPACSGYPTLAPATDAKVTTDLDTAIATNNRIEVKVEFEDWSREPRVRQFVTPLKVSIRNTSTETIVLQYQHLFLQANGEKRYAALPPYAIDGEITKTAGAVAGYTSIGFLANEFHISPYHQLYYPDLAVHSGPLEYDRAYYDRYYPIWQKIELPTPAMARRAIPEGVIRPQGIVSGVVFFEPVDVSEDEIEFRFRLVRDTDGDAIGSISIPFKVSQ